MCSPFPKTTPIAGFFAAAVLLLLPDAAQAGKIVVANDEWQTTNVGFAQTPTGSAQFAVNVAQWFAGSPNSGSFLVYSSDFSLDPAQATSLKATIEGAGYAWTPYTTIPGFTFNLATLSMFNGVFLALPPPADSSVLTAYVNAGGNVYIAAGTGQGGPSAEAATWNNFLHVFGLELNPLNYNGISGNIGIQNPSNHPVLNGVTALYQNNGNSISYFGNNPSATIIESLGNQGLYAVYESPTSVPEPSTLMLLPGALPVWLYLRHRYQAVRK